MRMRSKDGKVFEKSEKDLLDFARVYLSEAFPNPDRQGCPPDDVLRSLSSNPRAFDSTVTEHLATCSPCFRRYSELLVALKSQKKAEKGFSWAHIDEWMKVHPALVGTGVLCLVLIAIGAGLLFRSHWMPNVPPEETHRTPGLVQPVNRGVAYVPCSIDLSSLSPTRGPESSETTTQRFAVPRSPVDFTLTLPLASREGTYELQLTSGDRTVWSVSGQAHLHNGTTLIRVEADLSEVPTGDYNLEVQSPTGLRLIQPVSIQAAMPKNGKQKP